MADSFLPYEDPSTTDRKLDTESLTVGVNTVHRERIQVTGTGATDICPVSATNGLLVNLGANNDVTVTGSVTANAGTNLNTSALALETGGNLASVKTAIELLDDSVATIASASPAKGIAAAGHDGTNARLLKTDTSGELQVDVLTLPALVAGTANIGDVDILSIAAGDNNIGNVDIVTVPAPLSLTGGGVEASALRVTLANDSTGVLSVDDNGGSLTIDGTVTCVGSAAHDAAVSGNPVLVGVEARDTLGTVVATGDVVRPVANRYGHLLVTAPVPSHATSNGTPITTTTTSVIAAPSAGNHLRVLRIHMSNGGATATWVAVRDGASGNQYYRTYLPQSGVISINLTSSGPLNLTSATRLDIVLSAAGSVEYTIDYITAAD
jgi:hypothetical protein